MPNPRLDEGRWQARIARATKLAAEHPESAEPLRFYADLAAWQASVSESPGLQPGSSLVAILPQFIADLIRHAPTPLANGLALLNPSERWGNLLDTYWRTGGREPGDDDELHLFVVEALLQPFAELVAINTGPLSTGPTRPTSPTRPTRPTSPTCPCCTGLPVVAVLREEGHGARRSLLCGLCLTEWSSLRLVCPHCGESAFDRLPVFRAEDFAAARVDACESCKTYVKTIDLTRDGAAVPIVDDLATLPLDLWAREMGYQRTRPNVLRI